jgi:hypothetical protein
LLAAAIQQRAFLGQFSISPFFQFPNPARGDRITSPSSRALRQHPAFGAWRGRNIDALQYEQALRAEWDD